MAGAGYKLFATGDVLTAAQVNTYLQEQVVMVFANAAARTTALSGVLAEGMVTYLKDTDALEIYSGTAWVGYGSGDITGITTGATSGLTGGVTSGTADLKLNTTAKGGLLVGTGSGTVSELAVGSNTQVLTADSTTATGLKWATAASGSTFSGCTVYRSTALTTSNGTVTSITFDQELFDTDSYHSTVSNTNRLTIPAGKSGYFLWIVEGAWETNATGQRQFIFYKNGTRLATGYDSITDSDGYATLTRTYVLNLTAGDYVEVRGYQSSGGNLDIRAEELQMSIAYLGA